MQPQIPALNESSQVAVVLVLLHVYANVMTVSARQTFVNCKDEDSAGSMVFSILMHCNNKPYHRVFSFDVAKFTSPKFYVNDFAD